MIFTETKLKGAYIIELEPIEDERGFFARTFCRDEFENTASTSALRTVQYLLQPPKGNTARHALSARALW